MPYKAIFYIAYREPAGNWHLTLALFLLVVWIDGTEEARGVEGGAAQIRRLPGPGETDKGSRKYRKGGYTVRINSRSREDALPCSSAARLNVEKRETSRAA